RRTAVQSQFDELTIRHGNKPHGNNLMMLYILRHATADEAVSSGDDGALKLTERSKEKMRGAYAGLRAMGLKFDAILTSPLARAAQTAEIVSAAYENTPPPQVLPALATGVAAADAGAALREFAKHGDVMIVGHEPQLSAIASILLTGAADVVHLKLKTGGCIAIDLPARFARDQTGREQNTRPALCLIFGSKKRVCKRADKNRDAESEREIQTDRGGHDRRAPLRSAAFQIVIAEAENRRECGAGRDRSQRQSAVKNSLRHFRHQKRLRSGKRAGSRGRSACYSVACDQQVQNRRHQERRRDRTDPHPDFERARRCADVITGREVVSGITRHRSRRTHDRARKNRQLRSNALRHAGQFEKQRHGEQH